MFNILKFGFNNNYFLFEKKKEQRKHNLFISPYTGFNLPIVYILLKNAVLFTVILQYS